MSFRRSTFSTERSCNSLNFLFLNRFCKNRVRWSVASLTSKSFALSGEEVVLTFVEISIGSEAAQQMKSKSAAEQSKVSGLSSTKRPTTKSGFLGFPKDSSILKLFVGFEIEGS